MENCGISAEGRTQLQEFESVLDITFEANVHLERKLLDIEVDSKEALSDAKTVSSS